MPSSYHERIYAFLEKQLAEGRQAYIVCPMVEENGELPDERKAVTAYAEKLQKEVLPNRTVRFLHGKMKAKEKETVMRAFAAGEIDVLVSTTVVEVGVDVPNASVMLIENAGVLRALAAPSAARARGARAMAVVLHPRFRQPRRGQ